MRIEFGDRIIKTIRVKVKNIPGYLGKLLSVVGSLDGQFGEIKTVHIGREYKIRDLEVYVKTEDQLEDIIQAIKNTEGIDILQIIDIVEEVHAGGKIEIESRVELNTIDDLKLVYTPGVASICRKIFNNPLLADKYTTIMNNVGIVTNGSAILGLGDIGPVAGMPVMEGKALLFKILAGINGIPILIDTHKPEEIIETVKHIAPTFGAIKLEDIKAPECFEIETQLDSMLNIPVLHDDQHGTAIVVLAALINIERMTHTNIRESSVGIIGLGAAGTGIFKLLKAYGIKTFYGKDLLEDFMQRFEADGGIRSDIPGIMQQADIVIATTGAPGLIGKELVRKDQIILALSNPDPEITPEDALSAGAKFAADGRAVNNALAFPGIFKGALMAHATTINNKMKIAAAETIARFAMEGDLVPNILEKQVHEEVALAVERVAYRTGVARLEE